jgi:uncharacterized OsmC-like protein
MPRIEDFDLPLVFKVNPLSAPLLLDRPSDSEDTGEIAVQVQVRALEGMQKEAVLSSNGGNTWRMVCDEGHYLNGTDLAPFPLGFYTAGMQFSLMSELRRHAGMYQVDLKSIEVIQDNYYTMEGSALRGTMIGGAKSAEVSVKIESNASEETIRRLVRLAEASSPAHAMMRDALENTFSLKFNGHNTPVVDVNPSHAAPVQDPEETFFESIQSMDERTFLQDIISKLSDMEKVFGVEGGAGSSLHAEQKRTLHVHGEARTMDGSLMETVVQPFNPKGSAFRFVCDETKVAGGRENAPPPLMYLSAGVGFCYMTQIGRYAHITKQDLQKYEIVQNNVFATSRSREDGAWIGHANPFDTRVLMDADESNEIAQKTLTMGERTCFLHAAMRGRHPSILKVELNGQSFGL